MVDAGRRVLLWTRSTAAFVLSLGVVSTGALACDGESSKGPTSASASIGAEGGTLVGPDGPRVDIPAGALPAAATLTLKLATDAPAPSGAAFVSPPWTLEPVWLQFAQPIMVTFPVEGSSGEAGNRDGLVVATTAKGATGYLALASTSLDAAHVAVRTTHFATGAPVEASCPVTCTGSIGSGAVSLRCSTTCLGHAYLLSCAGPPIDTPCSCVLDGVVTEVAKFDATDAGAALQAYTAACDFPGTSFATSVSSLDAGSD